MKFLALFVSLIVIINISFFGYWVVSFYYIILISVLLILFLFSKGFKFNVNLFLIILAAFVSIMVNEIPSFFKPIDRFIAFILILLLISPLITSSKFNLFRDNLFFYLNVLIMIFVSFSIIGLIIGLPFVNNFSGFNGFFNHSMIMGPMAGISLLNSIYGYYATERKILKSVFLTISTFSFLALVTAGSRLAIIALLIAVLFFFYKKNQGNLSRFTLTIFSFILLVGLSYPLWEKNTEALIVKSEYAESKGDLYASRTDLWDSRIQEFQSSPIFGVGFASIDTSKSDFFDSVSGTIEPGSSWLVILSMIGLLGFIPFVFLILKYLFKIYKTNFDILNWAYLGSLAIMFIVHMGGEGYIFSAGSGLFFYLWLLLGRIDQFGKESQTNFL